MPPTCTTLFVTLLLYTLCLPQYVYGDSFKIGMVRDMFLRYTTSDTAYFQGADYFAYWANKRGGIYYGGQQVPVEVITRDANSADDSLTVANVKQQFENLINLDNITIAVGPFYGSRAGAALSVTEKYNKINFMVQPTTTAYQNITRNFAFQWTYQVSDFLDLLLPAIPKAQSFALIGNADVNSNANFHAKAAIRYLTNLGWQNKGVILVNTSLSDNAGLEDTYEQAIFNLTTGNGPIDFFIMLPPRDQLVLISGAFSRAEPAQVQSVAFLLPFSKSDFTAANVKTDQWITYTQFELKSPGGVPGVLGGTAPEFAEDFKGRYGFYPSVNTAQIVASLMGFYHVANLTGSTNQTVLRDALTQMELDLFTGHLSFAPRVLVTKSKPYPYQVIGNVTHDIHPNASSVVFPAQFTWLKVPGVMKQAINSKRIIAIAVPVGFVVIAAIFGAAIFLHRQRRAAVAALVKAEEGEKRAYKIDFSSLEVGKVLGEGSFGQVFSGVYRGADVAVKRLKLQKMTRDQMEEFGQEAAVMIGLRHPHIVLFMGVCLEPANFCIVTELMQKGSLFDIIHNDAIPLPFPLVMHMALDVLQGLQFIHSSGFVHRDLKSLNLLVDKKWNIKISDFGLSCTKSQANADAQISVLWTAPEIIQQQPGCFSEKSDIYSFGIILWEMLARAHPFNDVIPAALHNAIVNGKRPEVSEDWDEGYVRAMRRCWDRRPEDRPPVKECRQLLESIAVSELSSQYNLSSYTSNTFSDALSAPQPPLALVFTDVQSSTELWEMEPRMMMRSLMLHNEVLRTLIKRSGGYEVKTEGDAFMIAFSDPVVATNFCLRAQMDLLNTRWPTQITAHPDASTVIDKDNNTIYNGLRVRMGIHYGSPLAERDPCTNRMDYLGHMVNVAARISGFGTGGQIILGPEMYQFIVGNNKMDQYHLESLGNRTLKGLKGTFSLYNITPGQLKARFSNPLSSSIDKSFVVHLENSDTLLPKTYSLAKREKWVITYEDIKIESHIGAGSCGTVHSGEYQGVKVAVKKFINQKVKDNVLLDLRAETAILNDLKHPNIVKFFGSCVKTPNLCIVMELMTRGSLASILRDQSIELPMTPRRMEIAKGIARGLEYLHSHNIIHRDIKSSNILVGGDWTVKIADFGFSRIKADNQTMTQCGTVAWTAPEIFNGTHYTEKADVYGYGIVLWELLSRKKPWEGMHAMKIIQNVLSGSRPDKKSIPSEAPAIIKSLMRQCFDPDQALRPSFESIVTQLEG